MAGLVDLQALALERAMARGQRLIETRLGSSACHGPEFAGRVLVDEPLVGRWVAPSLTSGKGGVTAASTPADWEHAVWHGLRAGRRTCAMSSIDFSTLSDRALSDIAAFICSRPSVDGEPGTIEFGPILEVMLALGKVELLAPKFDHLAPHATARRQYLFRIHAVARLSWHE